MRTIRTLLEVCGSLQTSVVCLERIPTLSVSQPECLTCFSQIKCNSIFLHLVYVSDEQMCFELFCSGKAGFGLLCYVSMVFVGHPAGSVT